MARTLKAALLYGLAMFAAGFALGTVREFVFIRTLGFAPLRAELFELPLMLAILALVSRWLVKRRSLTRGAALAAGIGGALLLAALDVFVVGMGLRSLTFAQSLASLDPRTGTLFPYALALAACLPFIAAVWSQRKSRTP